MPGPSTIDVGGVRNTVPPTEDAIRIFDAAGTEVFAVNHLGAITAPSLALSGGDLAIADDLTVTGDVAVTGTTALTGAVTTTAALTVGTDLTVDDDLAVTGDATVVGTVTAAGVIDTLNRDRQQFLSQLLTIMGDTRLLWLANTGETTTSAGESLSGNVITHAVTQAGRITAQGLGYKVSFNGTTDYATTPDAANLSFGDATTDVAFSIVVLGNLTADANTKVAFAKYGGTTREWMFNFDSTEKLQMQLFDESVDITSSRISTAAYTVAVPGLWGAVYSAATGGATAGDDITLYENGVVKASTATNNASYVAMEDTAQVVGFGSNSVGSSKYVGSLSLVAVCQKALSASEMWQIRKLCEWYFNFLA